MRVGTKSVLFGFHNPLIHPWFVASAWWHLYGAPRDLRLWVCFFIHDLGYWGKADMDGEDGEGHVMFGARLAGRWFGASWYRLCVAHSRFMAQRLALQPSRLCIADKYALVITPVWLTLLLFKLSGEHKEYMAKAKSGKYEKMNVASDDPREWWLNVREYLAHWVKENQWK